MLLGEQGREQDQDRNRDPERFEFGQPAGPEDRDHQGGIGVPAGQGVVGLIAPIDPGHQLAEEVLAGDFRPDHIGWIEDEDRAADGDCDPQAERKMLPEREVHFQRSPGQGRDPPGQGQQIRDSPDRPEGDAGIDWQVGADPPGHILVDRKVKGKEDQQNSQEGESFAPLAIIREDSFRRSRHNSHYKLRERPSGKLRTPSPQLPISRPSVSFSPP